MNVLPPVRVRREYVQTNHAPPERVFPLLCPVREVEWASGWEPLEIYTASGLVEPGCVFTTAEPAGRKAVWVTTRHDPEGFRLELVKVTPELVVTQVEIRLAPEGDDRTRAHVAYTLTALTPEGRGLVEGFSEEAWRRFMTGWEAEINHHLSSTDPLDETGLRYE